MKINQLILVSVFLPLVLIVTYMLLSSSMA